jgi:hypothetical protein
VWSWRSSAGTAVGASRTSHDRAREQLLKLAQCVGHSVRVVGLRYMRNKVVCAALLASVAAYAAGLAAIVSRWDAPDGSMRVKAGLIVGVVVLAACGFAVAHILVSPAFAHQNPCHSQHTCPSDHHTYVWIDPRTGLAWSCAEPGAPEYDPALDTTVIVWDGLTYYCRPAAATTTSTTTTTVTTTTVTTATSVPETSTTTTTTTTTPTPQPELVLPKRSLTPGAYNLQVRQSTIRRTICVPGYTRRIRPSSSYTSALKRRQMPLYGLTGPPVAYEEDHLIPLELGGAPRSPKNLWPEPRNQARKSDPLETSLKRRVCARQLTLAAARLAIRRFKFTHV